MPLLSFAMAAMNYCSRSGGMGNGGKDRAESKFLIFDLKFLILSIYSPLNL